ncbi:hypothetical protein CHLNCDRAFT_143825 [Chlorella variabilis]|uniref:Uncharacterized protein n=1 Tax=Chlorella variabilis TaxID=554065 RepID=E1ZAI6_CHLVA|nr:hypothetical protein CHLNCDRAFT_143825 [Chlorella variabilis]EFN57071.1 hypothetical protein CHLNCDRAFT_143825 [Chlorella variabilis]|eukprot:XP_005849173.1 hypothetical protein CHLNCDRAFT_143825 [Chlorella variabilis]
MAAYAAQAQQSPSKPPRRTKRVPKRAIAAAREAQQGDRRAAAGLASRPPADAALARALGGTGAYALLLLQALLSVAAVLWADRLRPATYTSQEWQQLAAAAAVGASVLALAAHTAFALLRHGRRHRRAAAGAVTAAAAPAARRAVQSVVPLQDVSGTWIKDRAASDSMEPACDAMRLGGLVRTAIRHAPPAATTPACLSLHTLPAVLIRGVEVRLDGGQFTMSVLSGILWFKVTERYPLDGAPVQCRRRDLRRGGHTGRVERCPATGSVVLRLEWGEPLGGTDVLHVRTDLLIGGQAVSYTQVYRRKA